MYKNLLWDFDGTLFDSYPNMTESIRLALLKQGVDESAASLLFMIKRSVAQCISHYSRKFSLDGRELYASYRFNEENSDWSAVMPYPGAETVCRCAVESGGRNFLYTHRGRKSYEYMDLHGLKKYFTGGVTRDDPFPMKPAPDAINYLVERYGMRRSETVMIGDRDIDILAAHAAGVAGCLFDPDGFYPDTAAEFHTRSMEEIAAALLGPR
ncbi:MAG: HAD-IA family hydrolase [Clostridiales bacterium]|nr:HAD-IA family hydrolase [Clostridiales bacterium]